MGSSDSQSFQPLVEQLGEIAKDGDEVILRNPISLSNLLPGRTSSFYRYSGSLTTPACQQIVIWTIFDTPLEVSENQASHAMVDDEKSLTLLIRLIDYGLLHTTSEKDIEMPKNQRPAWY